MTRFVTPPAVVAAMLGLAIAAPSASRPQQAPIFRARTDIVRIDVTVLGPDGKAVHSLVREDFTLRENGEVREILGFGEVNIPDAAASPVWMREARPDVRSALDGRIFVFVLDDAQTPYRLETTSWINTVTRITSELIDRLGPQDIAAVICTYDKRCDQDFTNDHVRLKAAIGQFQPKDAYIALRVSAGITQSLAKYLKTEPGRRRSIIYVTPNMPTRPACWAPSAVNPMACGADSGTTGMAGNHTIQGGNFGGWGGNPALTAQQILHTFEEALRAGITVYGLNLSGLHALGASDPADPIANPVAASAGARSPLFTAPPRSLAAETGGFVVSQPNELAAGVDQIISETGSYYLLGFEPGPKTNTGYNMLDGFRELEVRVNRPDVIVRTHRGYVPFEPPKPVSHPPPPAMVALQGILPKTDLPLSVTVAPFGVPGSSEALLAIGLGVRERAPAATAVERLDVQARAFTQAGDQRAGIIHKVETVVPPTDGRDAQFDVIMELRLKPGVYALRCSADNTTRGVSGSVYADVEIPDFAKAPVSLSGVLLQVRPTPPRVFAADQILAGVPSAPTTQRTFTHDHHVQAFVRVYQGVRERIVPVAFTMFILNEAGARVYDRASTLAPALFAGARSADVTVDVPVRELAAGLHLLRIEVAVGGVTARRDVTFRIN